MDAKIGRERFDIGFSVSSAAPAPVGNGQALTDRFASNIRASRCKVGSKSAPNPVHRLDGASDALTDKL
jgi:hypothetical protein